MRSFRKLLMCSALLLSVPAAATASSFELDGAVSLFFTDASGAGEHLRADYTFDSMAFEYSIDRGIVTGSGTIGGSILSADRSEILGQTELDITLVWLGAFTEIDPVTGLEVIAIGREGTSMLGSIEFSGHLNDGQYTSEPAYSRLIARNAVIEAGGPGSEYYTELAGSGPFSMFLGSFAASQFDHVFHAWFGGIHTLEMFGGAYTVVGDIGGHAVGIPPSSSVPEPGSALLLATALLGSLARRRA